MKQYEFTERPILVKAGCYFCNLLHACEIVTSRELSHHDVLDVFDFAVEQGWVNPKDCSVLNPDAVCKHALAILGELKKRIYQVGSLKNGKISYWDSVTEDCKKIDFYELRYGTTGPIGFHYVLGDSTQRVIYDPDEGHYTRLELLDGLCFHIKG